MRDFENLKSGDNEVRNKANFNDDRNLFHCLTLLVVNILGLVRHPWLGLAEDSRATDF